MLSNVSHVVDATPSCAPPPPPRRHHPLPVLPGSDSHDQPRTRIPVPVGIVNASATVDRIAENLKGMMIQPVDRNTVKSAVVSKPSSAAAAAAKPVPPPKPVRSARPNLHASPAAEEDGVVVRHRKEPSMVTKDKASVYGTVPRSTRRDEKPFVPSAATRRRCEMTNVCKYIVSMFETI